MRNSEVKNQVEEQLSPIQRLYVNLIASGKLTNVTLEEPTLEEIQQEEADRRASNRKAVQSRIDGSGIHVGPSFTRRY